MLKWKRKASELDCSMMLNDADQGRADTLVLNATLSITLNTLYQLIHT